MEIPKAKVGRKRKYDFSPLLKGEVVTFTTGADDGPKIGQACYAWAAKNNISVSYRTEVEGNQCITKLYPR